MTKNRWTLVIPLCYPDAASLPPEVVHEWGVGRAVAFTQAVVEQVLRQTLPVDDSYRAIVAFRPKERTREVQDWLRWVRGRGILEWNEGATPWECLAHALQLAFEEGAERAVVIDPTCLELRRSRLEEIFRALDEFDAVLGPTPSRELYLVATRHPFAPEALQRAGERPEPPALALTSELEQLGWEGQMLDDAHCVRSPQDFAALPSALRLGFPSKFRDALAVLELAHLVGSS